VSSQINCALDLTESQIPLDERFLSYIPGLLVTPVLLLRSHFRRPFAVLTHPYPSSILAPWPSHQRRPKQMPIHYIVKGWEAQKEVS
jgi:hypothetical protein